MLLLLIGFHALLLSFSSPAWSAVFVEPTTLAIDETITVGAGSYSYYSLRLTTGSNLSVRLAVQGGLNNSLRVWLLDLENFQKFQANQEFAYFTGTSGTISNLASYRFSVPKSNIYYLILDNRAALLLLRKASVRVYTTSRQETDESRKIKEAYTALYDRYLKGLFVFPDFDIRVGLCGTENSFSTPDIFICMELNDALSKSGVPGTIAFVFLHEASHSLLKVWNYQLYDNEDAADELATVLLLLVDQEDMALQAAQYWAQEGSQAEAISKLYVDDRHSVSPQRARNITNWISRKQELISRWTNLLTPRFTDEWLASVANDAHDPYVQSVAKQEMATRTQKKSDGASP